MFGEKKWRGDLTGATLLDYGYQSTTARPGGGAQYAEQEGRPFEQATLRIRVPAGTQAIKMSGAEYEDELLLRRGLAIRVTSDSGYSETGGRVIEAEVVQEPPAAPLMMTGAEFDAMTPAQQRKRMKDAGYPSSTIDLVVGPTRRPSAKKAASPSASEPAPGLDSLRTLNDPEAIRDALDLRTVPDLKPLLREAGLPVSGKKRELVDRLTEHLTAPKDAPEVEAPRKAAPRKVATPADGLEADLAPYDATRLRRVATAMGVQLPPSARSKAQIAKAIADAVEYDSRHKGGDLPSKRPPRELLAEAIASTEPQAGSGDVGAAVAGLREIMDEGGTGPAVEGKVLRLLADDGGLTSARLRAVAEELGIDVPPDMRAKSSLQMHIAARVAATPKAPTPDTADSTKTKLTPAQKRAQRVEELSGALEATTSESEAKELLSRQPRADLVALAEEFGVGTRHEQYDIDDDGRPLPGRSATTKTLVDWITGAFGMAGANWPEQRQSAPEPAAPRPDTAATLSLLAGGDRERGLHANELPDVMFMDDLRQQGLVERWDDYSGIRWRLTPLGRQTASDTPDLTGSRGLSSDPDIRAVQVENRIRAAYTAVRDRQARDGHSPQWVGLTELRDEIGDTNRREVDAALLRMLGNDRGSRLIPEENQKTITQADRDSAINVSGEDKHLVSIEDPSPRPLPSTPASASTTPDEVDAAVLDAVADLDPVRGGRGARWVPLAEVRERLAALDLEQLRDIVAAGGMDRAGLAMKWKDRDRVVELIVDRVRDRSAKGQQFHPPPADPTGSRGLSDIPAVREVQVENRIRAAYRTALARKANQSNRWVGLADIRAELGDLDRAEVDRALTGFVHQPGAYLESEMNQSALTPADREAAVRVGGENNHFLRLDDPSPRPLPSTPASASTTPDEVDAAVLDAVADLDPVRGGRGARWVPLAELRKTLGDRYSREEIDEALRRLNRTSAATVAPDTNAAMLTDADRDAAVSIGGTAKHVIRLQDHRPSSRQGTPDDLTPQRTADIEADIRREVSAIAGTGFVSLTDLRARLGDRYPRTQVDQVLREMGRKSDVHLVADANQKALTPADRDAAVMIGNQPKHAIQIRTGLRPSTPDRTAARERNRLIEAHAGTARLLAEVDELLAKGADTEAIRQRLDPALTKAEGPFAGADPATVQALREALDASRAVEVENRIRAAYRDLATKPGGYVRFTQLRERAGVDRAEFDAALVRLGRSGDAVLTPEEDRRRITPADSEGAIRFGDMPTHFLSLEDPSPRPIPAGLRTAVDRATTNSRLTPTPGAGSKVTFDPATMDSLSGVDIPAGAQVQVVTRGTSVTLPDGTVVQLSKAVVTTAQP
jgi:hypothetical protein